MLANIQQRRMRDITQQIKKNQQQQHQHKNKWKDRVGCVVFRIGWYGRKCIQTFTYINIQIHMYTHTHTHTSHVYMIKWLPMTVSPFGSSVIIWWSWSDVPTKERDGIVRWKWQGKEMLPWNNGQKGGGGCKGNPKNKLVSPINERAVF